MLRSSLCDYGDAYILVSGTIAVAEIAAGGGNNTTCIKKLCFIYQLHKRNTQYTNR